MSALLLFLLVHCGGVYVVTQSSLTRLPRELLRSAIQNAMDAASRRRKAGQLSVLQAAPIILTGFCLVMLLCPPCFGFWWALALQQLGYWPFGTHIYQPIEAGLGGVAIGALWHAHTAIEVQDATTQEEKQNE